MKATVKFWALATTALIVTNLFSGYLNSWLLSVPIPSIGSVIRDVVFIGSISCVLFFLPKSSLAGHFPPLLLVWLIPLLYSFVVLIFSPSFGPGLLGIRNLFYPLILLPVVLISQNQLSNSTFDRLSKVISYWLILVAAIGIVDVFTDGNFTLMLGFNPEYNEQVAMMVRQHLGITRANAGVADALNYGYLMALATLFLIYKSKAFLINSRGRVLYRLGAVLTALACLLSLTRGAILALAISSAYYGIRRAPMFTIITLALGIGLTSVYAEEFEVGRLLLDRFTESDSGSEVSSQERVNAVDVAIDILATKPFGIGLGTQGAATSYQSVDQRVATDNTFFWAALEIGIFGAIAYFYAYWYTIKRFYLRTQNLNYRSFVSSSTILMIIACLLSSAPVSPTFAIFFWLLLSVEYRRSLDLYKF